MGFQPDVPEPGEDTGPDHPEHANVTEPVTKHGGMGDGKFTSAIQVDWRRSTLELRPFIAEVRQAAQENDGSDLLRRTGTDHEPVCVKEEISTEQRADHSTDDLLREEHFDPAQDNTGPQADQG